jgi:hypothetical protein
MRKFRPIPASSRIVTPKDTKKCPLCGVDAVVMLTPDELVRSLAQGDFETLAVCHPALGGCNQGFALIP